MKKLTTLKENLVLGKEGEGKKSKEEVPEETKIEIGKIKEGDYMIHVLIEETRQLNTGDPESTIDPIIAAICLQKRGYTKPQNKIGPTAATHWGDHIFLEPKKVTKDDFNEGNLEIIVFDKGFIQKRIIGSFFFDLSNIYLKDEHCIRHQWVALTNTESKDLSEVQGYLKLGVAVLGPDDEQVELATKEIKTGDSAAVLVPPQIKNTYFQIVFRIFRAEYLPKMDSFFGSCDGFVSSKFHGSELQTKVSKMDDKVIQWNEELHLPLHMPVVSEKIILKIWDFDKFQNDIIGSIFFNKPRIERKIGIGIFWANIYGAPIDTHGNNTDKANNNSKYGTRWKGRILMQVEGFETEDPRVKCDPIDSVYLNQAKELNKMFVYEFYADIIHGISLPKNEEFRIQISFGEHNFESSKPKSASSSYIVWNSRLRKRVEVPYRSLEEFPIVFVYLMKGNKAVCFTKLNAHDYADPFAELNWIELEIDKTVGEVKDSRQAGLIQLRMYFKPENALETHEEFDDSPFAEELAHEHDSYRCFVNIFQCRDLPVADSDGASDPYVEIYNMDGDPIRTEVVKDTVNPIWYEPKEITIFFNDIEYAPPIILDVFDKDFGVLDKDDLLGRAIIHLKNINIKFDDEDDAKPEWHKLTLGDGISEGEILCSFNIFSRLFKLTKPFIIQPESKLYEIDVNILGLRSLVSSGLFPVQKPYIKFNLKSLLPPQMSGRLSNIKTQPCPGGQNPTFKTLVKFNVQLPLELDLIPSLGATVYDNILKGLSQPLLGSFVIPLGEIIKAQECSRMEEEERENLFIKRLQHILRHREEMYQPQAEAFDEFPEEEVKLRFEEKQIELTPIRKNYIEEENELMIMLKSHILMKNKQITMVIMPKYQVNRMTKLREELDVPSAEEFLGLGFDVDIDSERKHYRRMYKTELEETELMGRSPFEEYNLKMGQTRGSGGLLGHHASQQNVGFFKGLFQILPVFNKDQLIQQSHQRWNTIQQLMHQLPQQVDVSLKDEKRVLKLESTLLQNEKISRKFLRKEVCVVRIYIIDAFGLPDKDYCDSSDPYLVVKLGRHQFNEREHYFLNNSNPKFYKMFEFSATFPGDSAIEVELWDYDDFTKDDLIGKTRIDIENRFFSKLWRNLDGKPIETRSLYHPSTSVQQGQVRLWVEITPLRERVGQLKIWEIEPKPPADYELRLVVWQTKNVKCLDVEGTSDIFIRAFLDSDHEQVTDTHYRCQNGNGSFNWRLILPVTLPKESNYLTIQVWDRDFLSGNDLIGDTSLDMSQLFMDVFENDKTMTWSKEYHQKHFRNSPIKFEGNTKFWLPVKTKNEAGELVDQGEVQISMDLCTTRAAKANAVGKGREEPNHDPHLPQPIGRLTFSLNPFTMINQFVGPEYRKYIYLVCLILYIVIMIGAVGPFIIGSIATKIFLYPFGL